jgi:hypothetical protein
MIKPISVFEVKCNICGQEFEEQQVFNTIEDAVDVIAMEGWEVEDNSDNCWCQACSKKNMGVSDES